MSLIWNVAVQPSDRFTSAYLAWLALAWDGLEHVDHCCEPGRSPAAPLLMLRLECVLLEEAMPRCQREGLLRAAQREQIGALLADLRPVLGLDESATLLMTRLCVRAAQDRILDEVILVSDRDPRFDMEAGNSVQRGSAAERVCDQQRRPRTGTR
jgi:hypothetical protein